MGLMQTEAFQAVLHIGETSGLNVCCKVLISQDKLFQSWIIAAKGRVDSGWSCGNFVIKSYACYSNYDAIFNEETKTCE